MFLLKINSDHFQLVERENFRSKSNSYPDNSGRKYFQNSGQARLNEIRFGQALGEPARPSGGLIP